MLKNSYNGNFKQNVIEYMHANHLSATQTTNHFKLRATNVVLKQERIYYEKDHKVCMKNDVVDKKK